MLYIWVCRVYIYINNEKLRPYAKKMMPIVHLEKLYGYKRIYNNVYIFRLNNGQIICTRDIRFYEEDPYIEEVDEEILSKAVFDKEIKRFILGEVIFGSGDRLLSFRILGPLRL